MFGPLGIPEILFILVLALLVFGPRKLPEVGRTIGRALGEFRRATGDLKRSFDQEMSSIDQETQLDTVRASSRSGQASLDLGPDDEGGLDEDDEDTPEEAEDEAEDEAADQS